MVCMHHDKMNNWINEAGFAIISVGAVRELHFKLDEGINEFTKEKIAHRHLNYLNGINHNKA